MEYGGGETHVIELSKYFAENGIEVKIMSNDGELFEKDIENTGIEHIYAPFHSRNIFDMMKASKILKEVIKSYGPDVIHAHSRIPAFIASGICKKFRIPLVTTMHYQFRQSFLLKLATNWGDYSLYVSEDIKDYWLKYYNLKKGCMQKTVNGINAGLFNAENNDFYTAEIRREFNIKPEEKIILTVSRHQIYSSYSAVKLCEIAEDIYSRDKNTRIIVVGDGELFGEIKSKADAVNNKLGFEYIIMTGRRKDVQRFCKASDIFVGISRAALEAMACEKPAILCGDHGYLGRFSRENAEKCVTSNFTCRSFGYPENINRVLSDEIFFCLSPGNKDTVAQDVKFGADLIREEYGVKKMADDAYSVYQKAVLKYKDYDFVLSGYYGYGNIGDDTLLYTVISNILQKKHDMKICLLTKNPKKFQKWLDNHFANITAKHRFNFFRVRNSIKKSNALVFGGGTLLCDNTSTRSFVYYSYLLKTAQKLGKKTILYANGIGPLFNKKNKTELKNLIRNITLATIRDKESYDYLMNLGEEITGKDKIYLTTDEALTVKENKYINTYKKDFKEFIKNDYVVISVRRWKDLGSDFFAEFSAAIDSICRENNLAPVYLLMQPSTDKYISEHLSSLNGRAYLANCGGDIGKVLAIVRSAEAVISMRLHALIFAAAFDIPMIGISYDPKVKGFMNSLSSASISADANTDAGENYYTVELKNFSKDVLTEKFRNLMSNKTIVKNKISEAAKRLREKAQSNSELFLKAMDVDYEDIDSGDDLNK